MSYQTLISTHEVSLHLDDPDWAIVDCRFALADTERGRRDYLQAHIPGAVYAHLDEDLSGPVVPGVTGRHPLPEIEPLVRKLSAWGIGAGVQVVAYDDLGGALAAARLWWLLRWLGFTSVAVLNGGWQQWQKEGRPVRGGIEQRARREFQPVLHPELVVTTAEVDVLRQDSHYRIVDSRAADRYRGQNETIDPVAGHIPGAVSGAYAGNLSPEGTFRPPERLRARFEALLKGVPVEQAVFYCGSGVTAAQNVLAAAHAGLGMGRLYAGSWSEWITDPNRPVET